MAIPPTVTTNFYLAPYAETRRLIEEICRLRESAERAKHAIREAVQKAREQCRQSEKLLSRAHLDSALAPAVHSS